jgi:hypothetical protein
VILRLCSALDATGRSAIEQRKKPADSVNRRR